MIGNVLLGFLIMQVERSMGKRVIYEFLIQNEQKDTFEAFMYSTYLSTEEICIGSPYQCSKAQFDPGTSLTMILSREVAHASPNAVYEKNKSPTFKSLSSDLDYNAQKMIHGSYCTDRMKFGPLEIEEGYFFEALNWINEQKYSSIGLSKSLKTLRYSHFVQQLYKNGVIDKNCARLEILNDKRGRIVIGDQEDLSSTQYKLAFGVKSIEYYVNSYFKIINIVANGHINMNNYQKVVFDESFGFIQMPETMKSRTYDHFLSGADCKKMVYQPRRNEKYTSFIYFLCPKNRISSLSKDNNLTFVFSSGHLTLRNEDLFKEYDDEYALSAFLFRTTFDAHQWVIGEPILKHYVIMRDYDEETFIFFSKETTQVLVNCSVIPYLYHLLIFILLLGSVLMGVIIIKYTKYDQAL